MKKQNSYFQNFHRNINTFPKKVGLIINHKKLIPGQDFILDPASGKGSGSLSILYLDSIILKDKKFLSKI